MAKYSYFMEKYLSHDQSNSLLVDIFMSSLTYTELEEKYYIEHLSSKVQIWNSHNPNMKIIRTNARFNRSQDPYFLFKYVDEEKSAEIIADIESFRYKFEELGVKYNINHLYSKTLVWNRDNPERKIDIQRKRNSKYIESAVTPVIEYIKENAGKMNFSTMCDNLNITSNMFHYIVAKQGLKSYDWYNEAAEYSRSHPHKNNKYKNRTHRYDFE